MTTTNLHESEVEEAALSWFGELGYAVVHGEEIAPEQPGAERESFNDVLLVERLRDAIDRFNPDIPAEAREDEATESRDDISFFQAVRAVLVKSSGEPRTDEQLDAAVKQLVSFLLYSDAVPAKDGTAEVSSFLGYWFIRKAMWASPTSIKQNASSLKKFYTCMHERGHIDAEVLEELKETIREEMPEWVATVERYDDPDITDPEEIWGL